MKNALQKFIIFFFALLFVIEPVLQLNQVPSVKADAAADAAASLAKDMPQSNYVGVSVGTQPINLDSVDYKIPLKTRPKTGPTDNLLRRLAEIHTPEDRDNGIGLEEALSGQTEPRIILNADDQQAVNILIRMSGTWLMPSFSTEPESIWEQYPGFKAKFIKEKKDTYDKITTLLGHEIAGVADISKLQSSDEGRPYYYDLTEAAKVQWSSTLGDVMDGKNGIKKQTKDAMDNSTTPIASIIECLSDFTGETTDNIAKIFLDNGIAKKAGDTAKAKDIYDSRYTPLINTAVENVKAVKIDTRVIKLLTYLVTPKTQGGAGHYKIKVKRILSGYTAPKKMFSRESNTIYSLNSTAVSDPRTAADYGQNIPTTGTTTPATPVSINTDDPDAVAIVTDQDGESYNAFVSQALAATATPAAVATEEKNISAHADGQAVDISEMDDIRCTLIKKRRVGGYSRSKFLQRPIKLAWQTSSGYAENGGGDLYKADMANVMKSFAADSIKDLVDEFGGDVTNYDGDLSSASFGDVAMLIGKSLFSQILDSPGANLQGFSFGDTLGQLGGMYMADYLGLPREMFIQGGMPSNYDELIERIGTAAVEKRLDLPTGTFNGNNLAEMLKKIGQRKVEYEMNLNAGALDRYFMDYGSVLPDLLKEERDYIVGKAIIEQSLNLPQGSFSGINGADPKNYDELMKSIGNTKGQLVFRDPVYADNMLHVPLGTTQALVNGTMTPVVYAQTVGIKRENDTIYGFAHMAAADSAYELDAGTFENILKGDSAALTTVGIKNMARVFTTGDDERTAFIQWVNNNLETKKDAKPDSDACDAGDPVVVTIPATATAPAKNVTLSDSKAVDAGLHKGDIFNMFVCPQANPRAPFQTVGSTILLNTLIQYYLTPDEKVKFNLLDVNPAFHSSDPNKLFYWTRIARIITIRNNLKSTWNSTTSTDTEYNAAKTVIDTAVASIDRIIGTTDSLTSIADMKKTVRDLTVTINNLKTDTMLLRLGAARTINRVNGTLTDVNELVRIVTEIAEGKEIPSTDTLSLKMIPTTALTGTDSTASAPVINNPTASRMENSSIIGMVANAQTLMALMSRKMSPADFFLIMATDKVETALDLPANSLMYFVQNFEKKGLDTVDSFYSAVGQAKVEETFSLPAKYFQGALVDEPAFTSFDFRNDLTALYEYNKYDVESKFPPKITMTVPAGFHGGYYVGGLSKPDNPVVDTIIAREDSGGLDGIPADPARQTDAQKEILAREHYIPELAKLKISDPKTFEAMVNKAQKVYSKQILDFFNFYGITSNTFEWSIKDVTFNVQQNKLNDAMRSAENDLLFRLGFSGSNLPALESGTAVAWFDANPRADAIDKLLNIPAGSTKNLFTGKDIDSSTGTDRISKKDKQILVAKMGISPAAVDFLLQAVSGEIPLSDLDKKAIDVTNLGDNPYLGADGESCNALVEEAGAMVKNKNIFSLDENRDSPTFGQMVAKEMIPESWFYFDGNIDSREAKSFSSQASAEKYRDEHKTDQRTYIQEIAYGMEKLLPDGAIDEASLAGVIKSFLTTASVGDFLSITKKTASGDLFPISIDPKKSAGISTNVIKTLFTMTALPNGSSVGAPAISSPLVSYKKAVGEQVVKKTVTAKLFRSLGVNINPDLFTGNEFFDIMRGDYSSLWDIAGAMVDQKLNVPTGSTMKILTAKSDTWRQCSVAEIGGDIIGKFVGLDYVSLKGNIYENIGRSRLEKMLGFPRDSFNGESTEQLMYSVGPVNFYLAFQFPILDLGPEIQNALSTFYGSGIADKYKDYSNTFKLTKIKEFTDINTNLSANPAEYDVWIGLKDKLTQNVKDHAGKAIILPSDSALMSTNWRNSDRTGWDESTRKQQDEIVAYLAKIDSIDNTFGIPVGTTASFIYGGEVQVEITQQFACKVQGDGSDVPDPDTKGRIRFDDCNDMGVGYDTLNIRNNDASPANPLGTILIQVNAPHKDGVGGAGQSCECDPEKTPVYEATYTTTARTTLTPSEYIKKISAKSLLGLAAFQAMDLFGFDMTDTQKQAVVGIITHYGNWSKQGNFGAAQIYNGLSTIFSLHLDAAAHLEEGSIRQMIENPGSINSILIPQAARQLDIRLGFWDPEKDGPVPPKWTLSGIYARYFNFTPGTPPSTGDDTACRTTSEYTTLESNIRSLQGEVDTWVAANSNPDGSINTDAAGYTTTRDKIGNLGTMKSNLSNMLEDCENLNRGGGTAADVGFSIPGDDNPALGPDGTYARGYNGSRKKDPINEAIGRFCSTPGGYRDNQEMCDEISEPSYEVEDCSGYTNPSPEKTACDARVAANPTYMARVANGSTWAKWKYAYMIFSDYAADKMSDYIFSNQVTKGTLRMPPNDIKKFLVNGDMRYFTAALMTYTANTWLNKLKTDNPSTPVDERMESIPTDMQIPYDMVSLWVVGNPDAENYASMAAAKAYLDPTYTAPDYVGTLAPASMGDVAGPDSGGGILGTLISSDFVIGTQNASTAPTITTGAQLIDFNKEQTDYRYLGPSSATGPRGPRMTTADMAATQLQIDALNHDAETCRSDRSFFVTPARPDPTLTDAEMREVEACQATIDQRDNLNSSMTAEARDARDRFGKQLEYRTMDAVLWTKDHNVFPGFSYMIFEGSPEQKNIAICTYLKNGFLSGEFFGQQSAQLKKFEAATGLSLWEAVEATSFISDLARSTLSHTDPRYLSSNQVLANAGKGEGLNVLSKFISHYSENWFGFEISPEYAKAALVGITIGQYGLNAKFDKGMTDPSPIDGKTYQTIGGLYKTDFLARTMLKPFAWADKQAKWKPGTAEAIYTQGVKLFDSINTYRELDTLDKMQRAADSAWAVAKLDPGIAAEIKVSGEAAIRTDWEASNPESMDVAHQAAKRTKTEAYANTNGAPPKTSTVKPPEGSSPPPPNKYARAMVYIKEQMVLYVAKLLSDAALRWIYSNNAKAIADIESKNSLVPGSISTLIDATVSFGVTNATIWAYNQTLNAGANMAKLGPIGLYMALALFIGMNLFGYYETDLTCDADGYYPEIESPSAANDSESGIGTWNGMSESETQAKTIASAQYKARRLISDVLEMHKNPKYSDVFPSQILTARNEDVLALNDSITENMCSVIGLVAVGGVCGGNTQAAVAQRDEASTYTHIGF